MLEMRHVTKIFNPGTVDEKIALNDLSFTLNDGDFVTVIGGNGAGKSTMQNAICGTWLPDAGEILLDGIDLSSLSEHQRAKYLGRVYQDPMTGTAAGMQIEENLALAARRGLRRTLRPGIRKAEREEYRQRLQELGLGLDTRLSAKVGTLSGGQRQALTLLMATLRKPKLLLLDEHTAALDPKTAAKVMELTERMVTEEKLSAFPKGREQVWFVRKTSERQNGNLGTHINGSSFLRVPAALLPLLNDNALLLSLLANYPKYEGSIKVKPVVDWFAKGLMMLDRGPKTISDYPFSGEILDGEGTEFQRSFIQNMIRKADVGISETKVERVPFPEELRRSDLLNLLEEHEQPEEYKTVVFEHDSQFGKVKFNINDESDGTYQLFSLSGHIAQALEGGATLFVDEIDASLHPILVREVVRCFLSPGSHSNDAQLVFTAHNPCLLDEDLLRRDQVWLTEKSQGATELYPLSEYSPRNDESLVSGYLLGRYSATPLVPACFGRCDSGCEGEACGD